jgi:hypothetical protein
MPSALSNILFCGRITVLSILFFNAEKQRSRAAERLLNAKKLRCRDARGKDARVIR